MGVKGNILFRFDKLLGINQDGGLLTGETESCENVIGEPLGFSVWKGRVRYSKTSIGATSHLFSCIWPDGHSSLVAFGENGLKAFEIGKFEDITGSLTFKSDPRNPTCMTMWNRNQWLIGANYLRDKPWFWKGKIDQPAEELPVGANYQVIMDWASRLWGIGAKNHPLLAFYGDLNEMEIKVGNWFGFRDNDLASKLVGCRPLNRGYAYFWGDRGLWIVERTGSYPLFARPQLIHADCDCVSNNSIVHIPGFGFAWMGQERMWLVSQGVIRRIDLSPDVRQARRICDTLDSRSFKDLHLVAGYYNRQRNMPMWSFPRLPCDKKEPWREPYSIGWRPPPSDSWWLINQGWQGAAEVEFLKKRRMIVTDQDGYLYVADYNIMQDKHTGQMPWHIDLGWMGDGGLSEFQFLQAKLTREISGVKKVMVDFYDEFQASPIQSYFDVGETFDAASGHPTYDPGGPNDLGLPPMASIVCQAPIDITGHSLKVRLSNKNGSSYLDGPEKPMKRLDIIANKL